MSVDDVEGFRMLLVIVRWILTVVSDYKHPKNFME